MTIQRREEVRAEARKLRKQLEKGKNIITIFFQKVGLHRD